MTDLLAAFQTKTGGPAGTSGLITGASSVEAFALAATRAASFDGKALAGEMEKFKNEDLTAGPTSFDATLHVNVSRPMAVLKITDGKDAFVEYRAAQKPTFPTK